MYSKRGLDYFSYPCIESRCDRLIRRMYGCEGVGVIARLLQLIYSEQGYFVLWDDEAELEFSIENGIDRGRLASIIAKACEVGYFERELYEKYSVLSSVDIQQFYFSAVVRRSRVDAVKAFLLIDPLDVLKNRWRVSGEGSVRNASEDGENVSIIQDDECNSGAFQGRVRQRKEKDKKSKDKNCSCEFAGSSFDTEEFFNAALRHSYKKLTDKGDEKNEAVK
jgi:hypothetical protein